MVKKQKHCAPGEDRCGDCWDHVALDPEHRLDVGVVVGKRTEENTRQQVPAFRERTNGRFINRMTSDEYTAYATAIAEVSAEPEPPGDVGTAGARGAGGLPAWLVYATVHKTRERNRVVKVEARLVLGTLVALAAALLWSLVSGRVNTVFV